MLLLAAAALGACAVPRNAPPLDHPSDAQVAPLHDAGAAADAPTTLDTGGTPLDTRGPGCGPGTCAVENACVPNTSIRTCGPTCERCDVPISTLATAVCLPSGVCDYTCFAGSKCDLGCFACCQDADCAAARPPQESRCSDHKCVSACRAGTVACGKPALACAAVATDFEGGSIPPWINFLSSEGLSSPSLVPHGRNGGYAVGTSVNNGGLYRLDIDACGPPGADLQKSQIRLWVFFDGPPLGIGSACVMVYVQDRIFYAEDVRDFATARKWIQVSSKSAPFYDHVTSVGISCAIVGAWAGSVYVDDVTVSND